MNQRASVAPLRKRPSRKLWRRVSIAAGVLFCVAGLLVVAIGYYSTTDDFQRRVGGEIIHVLDDATGGRTELGHLSIDPWRLSIEVRGLTIHGTESANREIAISVYPRTARSSHRSKSSFSERERGFLDPEGETQIP